MLIVWLQGHTLTPWLPPVVMALVTGRDHAATFLHCGVTLVLPLDTVPLIRTSPFTAALGSGPRHPVLAARHLRGRPGALPDSASLAHRRTHVTRAAVLQRDLILTGPASGTVPCPSSTPQACALAALRTRPLSLSSPTGGPGSPTQPRPEEPGSETRVWARGLLAPPAGEAGGSGARSPVL